MWVDCCAHACSCTINDTDSCVLAEQQASLGKGQFDATWETILWDVQEASSLV